jgi:hypothetical protein
MHLPASAHHLRHLEERGEPSLEQVASVENKKRKKPVYHWSLTCERKSALRHEVSMRAWQKRGLGIQNKTDTNAILALA